MVDPLEVEKKNLSLIWNSARSFFVSMFESVWSGFLELVRPAVKDVWDTTVDFWGPIEEEQWLLMLNQFVGSGLITTDQASDFLKLKDLGHPMDWIFYFLITWTLSNSYMDSTLYAASTQMRHAINSKYSPEIPYYTELMQAAFVAPEKTQEVRDALKKSGYSDEYIDLLFLSRYRLYPEERIRDLFLRGVLSNDEMFMRMRELGYTDTRIKELVQAWDLIPGPSDLFHLVAKEAFEPDMIEKIGLDAEFPYEQVKWLKMQGISEEWAKKYWYAHWDQPSIMQGFDMLHRGVIDEDTLDLLFRATEIPPFWRDKLTQIAYLPYTRVDVRRMHDLGILDDEQLIKSYMDLGYDDEKATNMALFTIKYNQATQKDLTKSEVLSGYKEKIIPFNDALTLLLELDYNEDQARYLLLYEDYKEQKSVQKDMIDNIRMRFQKNLIGDLDVRKQLGSLNLPSEQIDLLIGKWQIKRIEDQRLPSKTDLENFYLTGIIDSDTYRLEMRKIGYNFKYTEWYEQLVLTKKGK